MLFWCEVGLNANHREAIGAEAITPPEPAPKKRPRTLVTEHLDPGHSLLRS